MNIKRIGRALICLLLIFCLILNIAPPKAEATGAGLAATLVGASSVSVAAPLAVGAGLIALGVMASEVNPLVFENVVNDAVDSLAAAGNWVKDGTVELLQTVDETGQKAYYAAGEMLDNLRSWIYDTSIIVENSFLAADSGTFTITDSSGNVISYTVDFSGPASLVAVNSSSYGSKYTTVYCISSGDSVSWDLYADNELSDSGSTSYSESYGGYYKSITKVNRSSFTVSGIPFSTLTDAISGVSSGPYLTSSDLTLGSIPYAGAFTDGSSALEWAEEYARKALKVIEGGNDPDPDSQPPNDGKWFWPLALGLSVGVLGAMSQADEWSGQTPQEFNDYSTKTEFEILNRPEFDGWQGLEIAPATNPNPDPGTNPGTGGDSGSSGDTGSDGDSDSTGTDETTWFQRIVTGIEELPSKFQNWITDCKTAIEELPSKFADWFNKIIEILGNIWEWLQNLVSSLIDALKQLLVDLFAPSAEFIANKVNALCAKYPYLDTFLALGTDLKAYFLSLGTKPPIIYIDLGASRGSLPLGGRQAFIDLTWYAEYKPTMDAILGAFLWLWLAWRLFLSLPGLIQGFSGTYGSKNIEYERLPNMPKYQVGSNWLNSGSSYHKTGDWHHRDKVK